MIIFSKDHKEKIALLKLRIRALGTDDTDENSYTDHEILLYDLNYLPANYEETSDNRDFQFDRLVSGSFKIRLKNKEDKNTINMYGILTHEGINVELTISKLIFDPDAKLVEWKTSNARFSEMCTYTDDTDFTISFDNCKNALGSKYDIEAEINSWRD